jgi:hypothetical protein
VFDYITDSAKTDNGNLVATHGCSKNHPLEDMLRNKLLHNKTHGKQGEHFVLALAPCGESKSPLEVLRVVKEIVSTIYPENMAIIAGLTDSVYLHFHVVLDAVNAVTGHKFSQSPADLNRINKGLWHVNFYVEDVRGKKKRKQLSTGIKAYDDYGRRINKRKADEKAA